MIWLKLLRVCVDLPLTLVDISQLPTCFAEILSSKGWIGSNKGVYAVGDFVTNNNGKLSWEADLPLKQLHWQEDGIWIQIILSGDSVALYDKEELISYAESLR